MSGSTHLLNHRVGFAPFSALVVHEAAVEGSRETLLDAYRQVRNQLIARIHERFPPPAKPV
jgi:hypothetical protein